MARLTYKLKKENFPVLVERDGYECFYCDGEFSENHHAEYDHLNNNENDSRPENLVFVHHECNNKKKFFTDWQIKAQEKLRENERTVLACGKMLADTGTTEELTSSQAISKKCRSIALQWLEEHTITEGEIVLKDAVNAIVDLCQRLTGFGSQSAVYRYVDTWTNPYTGKFTLSTNEKHQTVIRRRAEN